MINNAWIYLLNTQILVALTSGIDEYIKHINIMPFKHYEPGVFFIKQKNDKIISILYVVATKKTIMLTNPLQKKI